MTIEPEFNNLTLTVKVFKAQCQGQINLLKGLAEDLVVSMYEDIPLKITKLQSIIAKFSENSIF
jgi:hypothetical protein